MKGGLSVEYMLRRDKTRKLTAGFSKDYVQLGEGSGTLSSNNMFNSLMSHRNDRQSLLLRYGVDYEHEFSRVFSGWIGAEHRRIYGNEQVPLLLRDQTRLDHVDATLNTCLAILNCELDVCCLLITVRSSYFVEYVVAVFKGYYCRLCS